MVYGISRASLRPLRRFAAEASQRPFCPCAVAVLPKTPLVIQGSFYCGNDLLHGYRAKVFQLRCRRKQRNIGRSDSPNGSIQAVERLFGDHDGYFGTDSESAVILVHNHGAIGLRNRCEERRTISGINFLQIPAFVSARSMRV